MAGKKGKKLKKDLSCECRSVCIALVWQARSPAYCAGHNPNAPQAEAGGSEVQGHFIQLEASLGCLRLCLKTKQKQNFKVTEAFPLRMVITTGTRKRCPGILS